MRSRRRNPRQGKKALIARLDFHDWIGELVSRTRGNVTEKETGVYMIGQILDRFDISMEDVKVAVEKELVAEAEEQRGINQVKWTRDDRGNITSPFSSRFKRI